MPGEDFQIVTYIGISHPQLEQASSSILDVVTLSRPDLAELAAGFRS